MKISLYSYKELFTFLWYHAKDKLKSAIIFHKKEADVKATKSIWTESKKGIKNAIFCIIKYITYIIFKYITVKYNYNQHIMKIEFWNKPVFSQMRH